MSTERHGRRSTRIVSALLALLPILPPLAIATPATAQVADSEPHLFVLLDQLELAPSRNGTPVNGDVTGWFGGDVNRLWFRAEADQRTDGGGGEAQVEALYGHLVAPFWDAVVGVRVDGTWEDDTSTRALLAVGLEGLAPYWFELEPTLYVSQDGDVSAQLEAEYELFLTQRLLLQPRFETTVAIQDVPEFGVGSGFTDLELGARLRYEIRRELAPYLGLAWHRRLGETADLARAAGAYISNVSIVIGLRAWY